MVKDILLLWFITHSILLCTNKKYRMYEIEFLNTLNQKNGIR